MPGDLGQNRPVLQMPNPAHVDEKPHVRNSVDGEKVIAWLMGDFMGS